MFVLRLLWDIVDCNIVIFFMYRCIAKKNWISFLTECISILEYILYMPPNASLDRE